MSEWKEAVEAVKVADLAVIAAQENNNAETFQHAQLKISQAQELVADVSHRLEGNAEEPLDFSHAKERLRHLLETQNSMR